MAPFCACRIILLFGAFIVDFYFGIHFYLFCHRYPGFEDSDESNCTMELLAAFDNEDPETMTLILNRPLFKYMENEVRHLTF
jgi:hypothetical protein